ncbi:MAG: hypothetical protein U0174_19465 [Polyangiaceae bacterium]
MLLRRTLRASLGLASLACISLSGCGPETVAPGLMLVFQSDMVVPKDVKAISLYVRVTSGDAKGRILYNGNARADEGKVQFPATFLLASTGKPAVTRIQLVAYRTRTTDPGKGGLEPFVLRESVSTVPTDRLARLRVPLSWLDQESVPQATRDEWMASGATELDFEAGFPSSCSPDGSKVFRGGACVVSDPDVRGLPEYDADADDPRKAASCFDAEGCFAKSTDLSWNATDCSVATGTQDPAFLNLALVAADGAGVEIKGSPSSFVVPLDQDPTQLGGYYIDRNRVLLSKVACNALKGGKATRIVGTGACAAKTAAVNLCGSGNPATTKAGALPGRSPALSGLSAEGTSLGTPSRSIDPSQHGRFLPHTYLYDAASSLPDIHATVGNDYQKGLHH